ncbi:MAG: PAS domain-containing protein [Thermoplasmata archaeon]
MRRLFEYGLASTVLAIPFVRRPAGDDPAVYRDMFDQARDGRFVLDTQGYIVHANPAAARLFGASELILRGVPFSELIAVGARAGFLATLASIRKPPSRAGPIELEGRFRDGSTFPIEIEVVHGTEDRFGVVVRDGRTIGRIPSTPAGRFNPGQVLIASRIQELV